jgi:hypothetical protein
VLALFAHGSSGRRVVNPAAGRFVDLGSFPLQRELGFDGSDDVLVRVAVHLDQPVQPAFGEEPDWHGVVDGIGVAERHRDLRPP